MEGQKKTDLRLEKKPAGNFVFRKGGKKISPTEKGGPTYQEERTKTSARKKIKSELTQGEKKNGQAVQAGITEKRKSLSGESGNLPCDSLKRLGGCSPFKTKKKKS